MRLPQSIDFVRINHQRGLEISGGGAGERSDTPQLLEAALGAFQNWVLYSDPSPSIPSAAAYLALTIARKHAFLDGNKRAGYYSAIIFADMNGFSLIVEKDADFAHLITDAVALEIPEEEYMVKAIECFAEMTAGA